MNLAYTGFEVVEREVAHLLPDTIEIHFDELVYLVKLEIRDRQRASAQRRSGTMLQNSLVEPFTVTD